MCIASPGGKSNSSVVNDEIGNPLAIVMSELPTKRVLVLSLFLMCMWLGCTALPSICTDVVPTISVPELILDMLLA
jgi:hypothetical protein